MYGEITSWGRGGKEILPLSRVIRLFAEKKSAVKGRIDGDGRIGSEEVLGKTYGARILKKALQGRGGGNRGGGSPRKEPAN